MDRKDHIDLFGGSMLVFISALLGLNQVLVKIVNGGLNPVFQAGARSALAIIPLVIIMIILKQKPNLRDGSFVPGTLVGVLFGAEFLLMFQALDMTTVARVSVFFYTMPVWLTILAHFFISGERMSGIRILGLGLAVAGIVIALWDSGSSGTSGLIGDLMALVASVFWALLALTVRVTDLGKASPEKQLFYQLTVSAIILIPASLFFGDLLRDPEPFHWGILGFQSVFIACLAFLLWFRVLSIYPASDMASFSFLVPVFGVLLGWLALDEKITLQIIVALVLVSAGIVLINRKRKPQN